MQDYSKDSVISFLDYLKNKGMMKAATVDARKAAVNTLLEVVDADEAADVRTVDLEDLLLRFNNLKGMEFTQGSLSSYKSRYKSALNDFLEYKKNPLGFKPNLSTRSRGKKKEIDSGEDQESNINFQTAPSKRTNNFSDQEAIIFPIPLRSGLIIKIAGIPSDLTQAEATKISNVIQALANEE